MRYVKIFLLYSQSVLEHKSRSLVWFLISLSAPLLMIIFWQSAFTNTHKVGVWQFNSITIYYFLLVVVNTIINSHVEENISAKDIREGELSRYLLRPISYYWIKFFEDVPYRVLQGVFSIVSCVVVFRLFNLSFAWETLIKNSISIVSIFVLAFFLIFTLKMILGLLAFWFTQADGVYDIIGMLIYIFGGYIIPIDLFNGFLKDVANFLPFSYMSYYPVMALLNRLSDQQVIQVLIVQIVWLGAEVFIYKILWRNGIKEFSAVGQ